MSALRIDCGRRCVAAVVLICVLFGGRDADAKLDGKAWKAAQQTYERLFAELGSAQEKVEVLETIVSDGSTRAWKLLAQALTVQSERVAAIRTKYAQAAAVHGDILLATIKGYSPNQESRAKDVQRRMKGLEESGAEEREVLSALIGLLAEAPSNARKAIYKVAKPKAPAALREAAAHVAGRSLDDRASLSFGKKLLAGDPAARVRQALLEGVAQMDDLPKQAHALIALRLTDEAPGVVERAGRAIAKHPSEAALEPVLQAWDGASHRVRKALAQAIRALIADTTLAPANADLATWWAKQDTSPPMARVASIPLDSKGVLFVVDVSTYMKPELKESPWKLVPAPKKGAPPPSATLSGPRVNVARHELQVALRKLPEDAYFNILKFNHGAALWERSMLPATKENKDKANRWLRTLSRASGSAYVEGSLRLAFRMAGAYADAEVQMPQIDTLVLLSAGTTTDNAFPTHRQVEPAGVLARVRDWNRALGLVIHTVCFGESEFLQKLAAENRGTYAHR